LVVEPTHLKNMLVKLDHFPKVRGENKKRLSCHHLENILNAPKPMEFGHRVIDVIAITPTRK